MTKNPDNITISTQLRQACKFSNAKWAAWLEPASGAWNVEYHSGITKPRQKWLETYLQDKKNIIWLAGALSHRGKRVRDVAHQSGFAGCKLLAIYPNTKHNRLLLVGIDSWEQAIDKFWKVIALQPPEQAPETFIVQSSPSITPLHIGDPNEPEDNGRTSNSIMIQIQTLRDFISRLLDLAQNLDSIPEANVDGDLSDTQNELFQYFVRQLRILTNSRLAQLKWNAIQTSSALIPRAVSQRYPSQLAFPKTVTDLEMISYDKGQLDQLDIVHQYLMNASEKLWVNDFSQWAGETVIQRSSFNGKNITSSSETAPDQHRWWSVLGIPLYFERDVVGTLIIADDRREKSLTQHEIELLEQLIPLFEVAVGFTRIQAELVNRVSAHHQTESHLVRSARLAAVGEMAAGVAHELNNPLTTVTGFVELVMNEMPEGSSAHTDLELALQEALRARGIVRGLLDFSRPSQDMRVPTDLNDLISQVLNLIRHMLRMNNLTIRLELRDDIPLVVVDPNKIQQVLLNLFQNAIRAMPSGGTLTIQTDLPKIQLVESARDDKSWVSISVKDTGVGIPSEALGSIFEPFYTLPNKKPLEESGVGLGLSVSLAIIQSHGGSIEVNSVLHQGSTFTVYLPRKEA